MDYSLINTQDGILVRLSKDQFLDSNINLTRGKAKAHAFQDETQARWALKAWVVS